MKTINIPTTEGITQASGKTVLLDLNGKKHRFFLQGEKGKYPDLVDYASGQIVAKSAHIMAARVNNPNLDNRQAAQAVLEKIVIQYGIDRVLNVLNNAPKIN